MTQVETEIAGQLRSDEAINVKHGLANVLYWGYARIGYRRNRIEDFVSNVSDQQVHDFQTLLNGDKIPKMVDVRRLHMPQYSGMSFVSQDTHVPKSRRLLRSRPTASTAANEPLSKGPH